VTISAAGVHRRRPDAKTAFERVRRQEQDLRSIRRPDGIGRSTVAVVVRDVFEVLAVGANCVNLAMEPAIQVTNTSFQVSRQV
jgi:hypothetical protein